jgi:WD40 repeat protein/tetratricopeptide (TPR) repeat protein
MRLWSLLTYDSWSIPINSVQLSGDIQLMPDGKSILLASGTTARLLDMEIGPDSTDRFFPHGGMVRSALASPDGTRILTASDDRSAMVWDAKIARKLVELRHQGAVRFAQFSRDMQRIVTASDDRTARVWDAGTGQSLAILQHTGAVRTAQFSFDGDRIVTASELGDGQIACVWEIETGRLVAETAKASAVMAQFSRDGEKILTTGWAGETRVWEANTGRELTNGFRFFGVGTASQRTDAGLMIHAAWKNGRVLDAETQQPLTPPFKHSTRVVSAEISADGRRAITRDADQWTHLWDVQGGGARPLFLKHPGSLAIAKFSPNSQRVVTCGGNALRCWSAQSGEVLMSASIQDLKPSEARFSPDGNWIAVASENLVFILNAQTGQLRTAPLKHDGKVVSVEFSAKGSLILTASEDKTARLWDAKSGSGVGEPFVHGAALRGAKFDLQSKRIFTFDGDGETRIWETSDGLRFSSRGSFKGGEPTGFSPDSKRIVTKDGWATRQWDALTGREIGKALLHPAWVNSAQFSPDGHQLLTGSFSGGVRIWDAGSGEPLTEPIHGGDGAIGRFSPDGRLVAAVSWTQPVRVYDAHTGLPVADSLWGADPEFSSNGNWLLTRDGENAWVWEMPPAQSNCPEWVLNLAEAISGQSLSSSGVLVTTALERERAATVQAIRRKLEDERGADDWTLWGRWFLADRGARTISPLSKTTTADYVFRRIQENSAASLLDAERLAAGNSNLLVEVHEARSVAELLKRAQSLRSQNLFEEAERLCRQALAIGLHFWTNQPSALESTVHDLADLLQEQHQESETEELFDDVLSQVTPDHPHRAILIRWRAEFLARHGRWKEATEALLQAIRLEPGDYWRRCIAATLLAHDGVVEKHFTHCHELLTRFRSVGEPWQQHDLGRALALLPASGDDLALASELSGKALASDKTSWLYPWYQLTRAMTEYREGHFTNATQWVEQSLAKAGEDKRFRAQAFSIKAMAQYALNQPQEARSALEIAERALAQELRVRDRGDLRPDWFDLLNAHTLVTEALWLIGGTTNGWATLSQFKSAKNAELSQWLLGWRPRLEEGSRVRRLVTSRTWSFSRGDGSMLAPNISLSEDGKILGYNNVNEARWALENGAVVFYNNRDEPSCRFTNFVQEAGKIRLSGAFLLGGTGSHVLKEGRLHLANRADTLRNEGKWDEAEATYREGLALNRESWTNYLPAIEGNIGDLVRFLLEEGKSAEAERVLSEAMGPQTDGRHEIGDLLRLRGECEARQAHWKQAAADFGQALQLSTSNYWVWRQLAPLLVQTHELDQYRSEGEAMLARFAGTTNVDAARAISLACLLFSPSQASLAEASKMADLAVATNNPSRTGQETFTDRLQTLLSQANQSTSFGTKALAEYRAGHFAEAADWMERGLSQAEADRSVFTPGGSSFYERLRNVIQRSPTLAGGDNGGADQACFVLAMARHQLKQPAEARAALARGIGILQTNLLRVDTADLGPEWSRVLVSQILLREAKTLIEGTDPAQIAAAQTIELTDALAAARTRFERMKPIRLLRLQEAALVVQRKPKDGEALYREALALHRRMVGNDDPDLAGSIRDLARTLADQGKLGEAETLYREKLSLFRRDPTNNTVQFRDSLLDLAGVLHRETNYSGIEQLFSDALPLADEAQPQFADLLSWQADIRSQYGHFKESAAEYAKLIEVASTNTWTHLNYCKRAALLIQTGDLAAYQKLRQEILDRFGSVTNANYAESIAKAVLLLPLEGDLLSQATQLAKRRAGMPGLPSSAMATGTVPTQPIPLSSSSSQTNANATSPTTPSSPPRTLPPRTFRTPVIALPVVPALAAYRQSQFMDATNYLQQLFTATNQSANPTLEAQAHFIVAMSLHRLGESRQAQTLLSKGAGILVAKTPALESTSVGPGWYELLIAHALLREAKALIEATEKTDGPRAEKPEGVASPDERKPASSQ